ncbi:MAG: CatB-related O-acetyltransferase [Holosporaceae bacterium]|jgi:chloramphenicol O-acetyltransferase type B|nr:CatB-related O-acetyltransferase [Holosporaceae bacterium]
MTNFKTYRDSVFIKDHLTCKHIIVGDYSYYSGYYHGHLFEDCVMYLDEGDNKFSPKEIDRLIIGKFCAIASGVKFIMGGNQGHNHNFFTSYPLEVLQEDFDKYKNSSPIAYERKGDTVVGNDVWIGVETLILPGVKIADGAVIGARSVITKNIEPYEIWAGNPAKLIRKRFSDDVIELLLEICWWNWDIEKIRANIDVLASSDVERLKRLLDKINH